MELRPESECTMASCVATQTEWTLCVLGDDIVLLSGHHILAQHCNTTGDGVPYLTGPSDFSGGAIRHTKFTDRPSSLCKPGDVLVTVKGSGTGTLVIADGVYCISRQLMAIRVREWDGRFVFYTLAQAASQFQTASTGLIPGLSRSDIVGLPLLLPPIAEQRAIATALSDVDALITGLDRLVAKKRDIKQAAMQQLLTGQTRLPGFSGEWEVKRLGDVGDCLRGVAYRGDADLFPHDTEQTKRLLRSNNVQNATVVATDVQFVNSACVSEHQILRAGDVLICMANGSKSLVGKAGYFDREDGYEYTFGAFMGVFRCADVAERRFVFFLFQTGHYRDYISNLLAGSSINNLSPASVMSLEFDFPSKEEQTAIATVLSDMDAELTTLESRLAKTRAIKQGMMQELLTGRTRLV
jgi:type I restriction enzyme S subunit